MSAIKPLVPDINTLSLEDWKLKRTTLTWKGVPIHKVSWQEYLLEQLSEEAFQLLVDLGYVQMIA